MPGTDIIEEYDTAKDYVREKFEEDPKLANSDTELIFNMIQEALGISLPLEKANMPSIGTITRASRELRNEEGYNELVDDDVQESREKAQEAMKNKMANSSTSQTQDSKLLWDGSNR